jgi:small subunit ribosomal protein S6
MSQARIVYPKDVWYNGRQCLKEENMVAEKTVTKRSALVRDYELVLIINPGLADDAVTTTVDTLKQFITTRGGTVVEVAPWGKKKLSYPIKHHSEGNYIFAKLQTTAALSKEIEAQLRISENVIRFLVVRVEA